MFSIQVEITPEQVADGHVEHAEWCGHPRVSGQALPQVIPTQINFEEDHNYPPAIPYNVGTDVFNVSISCEST